MILYSISSVTNKTKLLPFVKKIVVLGFVKTCDELDLFLFAILLFLSAMSCNFCKHPVESLLQYEIWSTLQLLLSTFFVVALYQFHTFFEQSPEAVNEKISMKRLSFQVESLT